MLQLKSLFLSFAVSSATMALLSLLVWSWTPRLLKRYESRSLYRAWLVLLLGFLIPLRPQAPFSLFQVRPASPLSQAEAELIQILSPFDAAGAAGESLWAVTAAPTAPAFSLAELLPVLWLVGGAAVLGYQLLRHLRFARTVNRWREPVTNPALLDLANGLAEELGIRRQVLLYRCACIDTPMMTGFFRPVVVLPDPCPSSFEAELIIKHELVHYRRGDLWLKLLQLPVAALHWFNPAAYLACRTLNRLCETSCDAQVLGGCSHAVRQEYATAVLDMARRRPGRASALTTSFYEGKNGMKQRLLSILDSTHKATCGILLSGAVIGGACLGGMILSLESAPIQRELSEIAVEEAWTFPQDWAETTVEQIETTYDNRDYLEIWSADYQDNWALYREQIAELSKLYSNQALESIDMEQIEREAMQAAREALEAIDMKQIQQEAMQAAQEAMESIDRKQIQQEAMQAAQEALDSVDWEGIQRETDRIRRETMEEVYKKYEPYGLVYDQATDQVTYHGEIVRRFEDNRAQNPKLSFQGTMWTNQKGTVDVRTVRDKNGNLAGMETFSWDNLATADMDEL